MAFKTLPLYNDTVSTMTKEENEYVNNDTLTTKALLNSIYGKHVEEKYMNREYISVIVDDKPTVIFKRNIIAVTKNISKTEITCVSDLVFYTKEDYALVVKKIID